MNKILRRFFPRFKKHLTDEQLVGLFREEMSWLDSFLAKRHLAGCQRCRIQEERLEDRAEEVVDFFEGYVAKMPLPALNTEKFLKRFDEYAANRESRRRWSFRRPVIALPKMPTMNPTLATCLVLSFAAIVTFFMWFSQRAPNVSSNKLLVRAENWDDASFAPTGNVIYRSIKITTPQQTIRRSIYRDPQGKRQPREVKLGLQDQQLKNRLATAGVDWDEPLSATGYQQWHDRQRVREDEVTREGHHLLMLTTTAPEGPVSEQSLTVRESDFHPVSRRIAFRDSGTVEIAELEFKILPWAAVDTGAFAPLAAAETMATASPARILPFRLPAAVTTGQLDEAELGARLVLNQLHADMGEQIQINRDAQGVEVTGLVDSDERKRQLQAQLRVVPHVTASIQSLADLRDDSSGNQGAAVKIATGSMSTSPSPLETYLLDRGRNVAEVNALSQRLSGSARTIRRESQAIDELQTRFAAEHDRTVMASATFSELVFSHRERLESALKDEREILTAVYSGPNPRAATTTATAIPLLAATDRNLALCKELLETDNSNPRNVEAILVDLSASLDLLEADARHALGSFRGNAALDGKR